MSDRIRPHTLALLRLCALVLAIGAFGCGLFKPDEGKEKPQPFQYPDLSTPQNVLLNLKNSWERRDSVRTRQIYDDAYQGTSQDTDNSTITFTKDQEVATVWAMGRDQNIQGVRFTLQPENTWVRLSYSSDPAGWTALQLPIGAVNIQVDDVTKGTLIANSSNLFEFKFVPTLDNTSPTDTTWKIVRWTETR